MTDQQILTLALSIAVPVALSASAVIYSNSRINDAKETLRAEMALGFERVLNAIKALETKLATHELEHHK